MALIVYMTWLLDYRLVSIASSKLTNTKLMGPIPWVSALSVLDFIIAFILC